MASPNVILPNQDRLRERQFGHIVGSSPALESVIAEVERVAPTDSTVLVLGETGTGSRKSCKRSSLSRSTWWRRKIAN